MYPCISSLIFWPSLARLTELFSSPSLAVCWKIHLCSYQHCVHLCEVDSIRLNWLCSSIIIWLSCVLSRDVNEASKVRGRGQIPQGRGQGQGQKNLQAKAKLCEAEARVAVLTMNYWFEFSSRNIAIVVMIVSNDSDNVVALLYVWQLTDNYGYTVLTTTCRQILWHRWLRFIHDQILMIYHEANLSENEAKDEAEAKKFGLETVLASRT